MDLLKSSWKAPKLPKPPKGNSNNMADTKVSGFTSGVTANGTDRLGGARSPFAVITDSIYITPVMLGTYFAKNTLAAGTLTDSAPMTLTQTWNDAAEAFTGLKVNITSTASLAASLLLDLQVAGSSVFNVSKDGTVFVGTPGIYSGAGSPESSVSAPIGSIYMNTSGGTDTTLYTKNSGAGTNTGWVAVDNV